MAEIMFSLDCVSVCAQQTGQSDSMVLNANSSKTVKTIRTSNFTYEFPGSVRTWCPKILAKGHDQGHWPSKLKKKSFGGDIHSHELQLVLYMYTRVLKDMDENMYVGRRFILNTVYSATFYVHW